MTDEPIDPDVDLMLQMFGLVLGARDGLRIEVEARLLVADIPELGEPEIAERVVRLAAEMAEAGGCPDLANEPAMWRAAYLAVRRRP